MVKANHAVSNSALVVLQSHQGCGGLKYQIDGFVYKRLASPHCHYNSGTLVTLCTKEACSKMLEFGLLVGVKTCKTYE